MRRNEGFSLVELIVVIAILAVLAGVSAMGVGMLGSWRVNQCVSLLDSALKETRVSAMSKGAAYLTISCDSAGNYYMELTGQQREKIASDSLEVVYTVDGSDAELAITPEEPLILSYDRASGAFLPIQKLNEEGKYEPKQSDSGEDASALYCASIVVRAGERSTTIKLYKNTGKHETG